MSFAAVKEIDCRNNSELVHRAGVMSLKYWDGLKGEETPGHFAQAWLFVNFYGLEKKKNKNTRKRVNASPVVGNHW